jgi:periplasmic copper chaperone A
MKRFLSLLWIVWIGAALAGCGGTGGATGSELTVRDAWARPGQSGGVSAVYFVVDNPTSQPDTLRSAATDVAMMTELHISSIDAEGTMKMMHQDSVAIPASQQVMFEPGGLHIMLMNLKEDLREDQRFTVTLNFERAGQMTVDVQVRAP